METQWPSRFGFESHRKQKKILFDAVKIVINNSSRKEEIIKNIQIPAIGKKISLKEFVSLKDKEGENLLKYIISKEGRSNRSDNLRLGTNPTRRKEKLKINSFINNSFIVETTIKLHEVTI